MRIFPLLATFGLASALACGGAGADDTARQEDELRAFVQAWNAASNAGDTSALRDAFVEGDTLRWYEDGELRYRSREEMLAALRGFPPGTRVSTTLSGVDVVVLDRRWGHVSAAFETRIQMPQDSFNFGGVFTALVQRGDSGWRFREGHSSSRRER